MAETPTSFPEPGEVFQGRYRIERTIGKGGFSRVYLATQLDLGREVALKVMAPEWAVQSPDGSDSKGRKLAERFMQEARIVSKLRGPYTVTMFDHGRSDRGHLYMVLEFVDGASLAQVVKAEGALAPERVVHILRQALESLQEAHALGLLHRDIKPGNIMLYEHLGRRDNVKVLDFGIAKVVGAGVSSYREDLTQSGNVVGTPRYMAPEQIRGDGMGPASDIYSLGLVAFEMLVGRKAVESESSVVVIGAQLDPNDFELPPLPQVPDTLRAIVQRMLAKDVDARYQDTQHVLDELAELVVASSVIGASGPLAVSPAVAAMSLESPGPAETEAPRNNKALIGAAVALGVALLVAFVAFGPEQTHAEPAETDATGAARREDAAATRMPTDESADEPREVAARAPDVGDRVETDAEAASPTEMVIDTEPTGARIFVNGAELGPSPVTLQTADTTFPAKIRAVVAGGGERLMLVDAPLERASLDLTMLVKSRPPETGQERSRKRPTRSKTGSLQAKKTTKKSTDTKQKKNFTLPALDY